MLKPLSYMDVQLDRRSMLRTALAAGAAWSVGKAALGAGASSPLAGMERRVLQKSPEGNGNELVMLMVTFAPGVSAPSHYHPVIGHNFVLEGEAESQYAGEPLMRFKAGDSFQDRADREHVLFRNASATAPLRYILTYSIKAGDPYLILPLSE